MLAHLAHSGDVSVRDIEARLGMEKSQVSRAASRLEAVGYIAKKVNDGDRRLVRLSLTDAGRGLLRRLLPLALDYQRRVEVLLGDRLAPLNEAVDILIGQRK